MAHLERAIIAGHNQAYPDNEWPIDRRRGNDRWLMLVITDGAARIRSNEQVLDVTPGDCVLWPPLRPQAYCRAPEAPCFHHAWVVFPSAERWRPWIEGWTDRLGDALIHRCHSHLWPQVCCHHGYACGGHAPGR